MISVIIPAYNEEAVICRTLNALTNGAAAGELDIIVICNGCTDSTADMARSVYGPIRVVESDQASKTNALNIGDTLASGFPRFYIDADLVFTVTDLRKVVEVLCGKTILAAAPEFIFNLSNSSKAVKAYYRVWRKMPYFDTGRIAGAYGISREGRSRFSRFPDVISDDSFVRLQFASTERATIVESKVIVTAPRTLGSLLKIKMRSHAGNVELRRKFPELFKNETAHPRKSLVRIFTQNLSPPEISIYLFVSLYARIQGKIHQYTGSRIWYRDESSRKRAVE